MLLLPQFFIRLPALTARRIITVACLGLCIASAGAAAAQPAPSVSLLFAGDIVLDGKAGKAIEQGRDPFAPFAAILNSADIRIGNLECVIATGGDPADKNYTFRADPRTLPVLKRHFDAVALANNHSGDYGRPAFAEMLGLLDAEGILKFGGGHNLREAHAPLIVERNGLRIALLSYNEFMPRSFEADFDAPGVAWSEDEQVVADIKAARSIHQADLVIPIMHWGWENESIAGARQRQLARRMIDAGADAIIGGHPHVTQDIEHYKGKPIIYSVGNFVMEDIDNPNQAIGWVLRLQLDRQGVQRFDTRIANLDSDGFPHPAPNAQSPCWQRGQSAVALCENGN